MAETIKPIKPITQKTGTGYTNLQQIIGANKNNKLGSAINTGVGQTVNKFGSALGQAKTNFNTKLGENTLGTEANKKYVTDTIGSATGTVDKEAVDKFAKFRQGAYAGPDSLENYNSLKSQGIDLAKMNREAALRRFVGGNQYTQGQSRLDNMILGRTGGGAIQGARSAATNMNRDLMNSQALAGVQAETARAGNRAFGEQVTGDLAKASGDVNAAVQSRVDAAVIEEGKRKAAYDAAMARLGAVRPTDSTMDEETWQYQQALSALEDDAVKDYVGNNYAALRDSLRDMQMAEKYGQSARLGSIVYDPRDALKKALTRKEAVNPDATSVGTAEEAARLNALTQLAGKSEKYDFKNTYGAGSTANLDPAAVQAERDSIKTNAYQNILKNLPGNAGAFGNMYSDAAHADNFRYMMNSGEMGKSLYDTSKVSGNALAVPGNAMAQATNYDNFYRNVQLDQNSGAYKAAAQHLRDQASSAGRPISDAEVEKGVRDMLASRTMYDYYLRHRNAPGGTVGTF